jgi:hypothetical protein
VNGPLRIGACLSLSGRFAQFGRQAALGLSAWRALDGNGEVVIGDDRSDTRTLEAVLPGIAARCDLLLGPYSTVLMRAAGRIAVDLRSLIWNHGGSGDDVEQAHPGHVISVLTPASRYAEPFLRFLRYVADGGGPSRDLCIVHGSGSFGRQVVDGAARRATQLGIRVVRAEPDELTPPGPHARARRARVRTETRTRLAGEWDLFGAGGFEEDAELTRKALRLPRPPQRVCTVAAGVREFAHVVDDPDGVFGVAQWFPGAAQQTRLGRKPEGSGRHETIGRKPEGSGRHETIGRKPEGSGGHETIGPGEEVFLRACAASGGGVPDYPAAQAAAGAVIAAHCARLAGSTKREDLWAAAASLDTSTLFGGFRVDRASGAQVKHETVLVRWAEGEPVPVACAGSPGYA